MQNIKDGIKKTKHLAGLKDKDGRQSKKLKQNIQSGGGGGSGGGSGVGGSGGGGGILDERDKSTEDLKERMTRYMEGEDDSDLYQNITDNNKDKDVEKYEGTLKDGKAHGVGKLTNLVTGEYYEGLWVNGKKHGYGTKLFATHERYQGEWNDDMISGNGNLLYPKEEGSFIGEWEYGKRTRGEYKCWKLGKTKKTVITYTNQWTNDEPGPSGEMSYSNGGKYVGEVTAVPQGKYTIKFYTIMRHGYGEMIFKDKSKYVGYWKNDKRKGFGVYVQPNGEKYYGSWSKGKKSGTGVHIYLDGSFYEGGFFHGERKGKGRYCAPTGDVVTGEWSNNKIINAQYTSRKFTDFPRPLRAVFLANVTGTQRTEDVSLYSTKEKWTDFIDEFDAMKEISNLGDTTIFFFNMGISLQESTQSFRDEEREEKLGVKQISLLIARFLNIFNWVYDQNNIGKTGKKDMVWLLQCAIDDVNSFIACLSDQLKEKLNLNYQSYKMLMDIFIQAIFPKIYDSLFSLYKEVYKIREATLRAKILTLTEVTPALIGVKEKYQLDPSYIPPKPKHVIPSSLSPLSLSLPSVSVNLPPLPIPVRHSLASSHRTSRSSFTPAAVAAAAAAAATGQHTENKTHTEGPTEKALSLSSQIESKASLEKLGEENEEELGELGEPKTDFISPKVPGISRLASSISLVSTSNSNSTSTSTSTPIPIIATNRADKLLTSIGEPKSEKKGRSHKTNSSTSATKKDLNSSTDIEIAVRSVKKEFTGVVKDPSVPRRVDKTTASSHRRTGLFSKSLTEGRLSQKSLNIEEVLKELSKASVPYQSVIDTLQQLNSCKTPVEKVNVLKNASTEILTCVDKFFHDKTQNILMGAEDKFPVLIYALIRANVPDLLSNCYFLQDFLSEHIGGDESKYRATELMDAIKYILSLDWELRDANGILVPLKVIISAVTWSAQKVNNLKFYTTDHNLQQTIKTHILLCISTIFRMISSRKSNLFEPLEIPQKYFQLISSYESFFKSVFCSQQVGLKLILKEQEEKYCILFELKYPLFVYSKVSEACILPSEEVDKVS